MLYSVVAHVSMSLTLFGFSHQGPALDAQSLIIAALMAANGVAAFGLISGRSWGVEGGILVGVAGLVMVIASIFVSDAPGLHIPLEPLFQIPFIWTLIGLRTKWQPDTGD
jgi:hypothetical protein